MSRDNRVLLALAATVFVLHVATNGQYGFHRDELATVDDARQLEWGYVAYPPFTPFAGRAGMALFGLWLPGIRLLPALAEAIVVFLAGCMARELGGGRWAQVVAAGAVAIGGVSFTSGSLLQYVGFDFLWWVLSAYFVIRLLKSGDVRWWVPIGTAIGLGLMTKYTMGFLVAGIVAGVVLTDARRFLRSPWLWCGAAVAVLVCLPNVIWQMQHQFISLDFLQSIHKRDVSWGRADHFLLNQLWIATQPITVPIWLAGLFYYFVAPQGRRYRMLGWMYVTPLMLFTIAKGRDYYMAPGYPMLIAAGAVWIEEWLRSQSSARTAVVRRVAAWGLVIGGVICIVLLLPIAPPGSRWWAVANGIGGDNFNEEIGWPELVGTVASVRDRLPAADRSRLGILSSDVGQAGAITLFGPQYQLPNAITAMNSGWLRGYGDAAPQVVILTGFSAKTANRLFGSCEVAGKVPPPFGIQNYTFSPTVFVCRGLRQPWPDFWSHFRFFG